MTKQLMLGIHPELIIDNFAGGGGASTGIELALGRRVDIAINHDPEAVAMHTANHPETQHFCESVWEVNPREIADGRPVGLVWLSPDCKHFSKAKGGKPVEKKIRGLAWVALRWAATVKPRVIMLENVEEFVTWGPLVEQPDGTMRPCPKRRGREFGAFVNALRRQGYAVEWRELRACDFGAPTIRKRLFLIARRDGMPIVWPERTHGDPKKGANGKRGALKPWRTAAECIDWALPCPSIFEREKPLADATCRRIAKGIMRYVVEADEPFIVTGDVAPVMTEHANASSPRSWGADEPLRTICAQTKGGHHALVAAFLSKYYTTSACAAPLDAPVPTVTSWDHNALCSATLIQTGYGEREGQSPRAPGLDKPIGTLVGSQKHALVAAFLAKYYGSDQDPRMEEPMHTITTKDRFGLVTVAGEDYAIADIGLRMLAPHELFRAQGFPGDYIIDHGIDADGRRVPLTKTAQVRMCGNSVSPPVAAALVEANLADMAIRRSA